MKIIDIHTKREILYVNGIKCEVVEDDECLFCLAEIDEYEIFCCDECQEGFDEENPESELKDIEL